LIYALAHLGELWPESRLLSNAMDLVQISSHSISEDKELDIISGSAGYLGGLVALMESHPAHPRLWEAAIQAGEHLLANAKFMPEGIAWIPNPVEEPAPLTGFAHGASGIALALLRLFSVTGDTRYRDAAFQSFQYERSRFDAVQGNWLDLRKGVGGKEGDPSCMVAWCHGAPGIGLARFAALNFTEDPLIHSDLDAALETTWRQGLTRNQSLCHGDLGNLELLLQAQSLRPGGHWGTRAMERAGAILQSARKEGWLCGTPSGIHTPELMTGLAGIGYQLLRLADPRRVPSLLAMEPPPVRALLKVEA
jgi:lantibiotic modifying enzyme